MAEQPPRRVEDRFQQPGANKKESFVLHPCIHNFVKSHPLLKPSKMHHRPTAGAQLLRRLVLMLLVANVLLLASLHPSCSPTAARPDLGSDTLLERMRATLRSVIGCCASSWHLTVSQ